MSPNRILAVFYKDFMWAMYNQKLLALILIPPLISVFFQFSAKGGLLGFSLTFSFAMIGCFLTSYLVTEEKRIESLKNILITPLTPSELSMGKLLLPLVISLALALLTFSLAGKPFLLLRPSILAGIMLMAGTVCLMGLLLGLFVKNEQELGIIGPLFIFLFMGGSVMTKTSGLKFAGFFPEFHLVHLIDNYTVLSNTQTYMHLFYLLVEFAAVLLFISTYLRFFFSSDADSKRIDGRSLAAAIPFLIFLAASGFTADQFQISNAAATNGTSEYVLTVGPANVAISYDSTKWEIVRLKNSEVDGVELRSLDGIVDGLRASLRELETDELSFEQRKAKAEKENVVFMDIQSAPEEAPDFLRTLSASPRGYKTIYERQCNTFIAKFGMDHPLIATEFGRAQAALVDLVKNSRLSCPASN